MSKGFLATCMVLMIAAGFYGATDMVRDLRNGELIDYENLHAHHAKGLLFIHKATGQGAHKYRGRGAGKTIKVKEANPVPENNTSKVEEYLEDFTRGDEF